MQPSFVEEFIRDFDDVSVKALALHYGVIDTIECALKDRPGRYNAAVIISEPDKVTAIVGFTGYLREEDNGWASLIAKPGNALTLSLIMNIIKDTFDVKDIPVVVLKEVKQS